MGWINDSELCYRSRGLLLIITSDYMQHPLIFCWLICCIFFLHIISSYCYSHRKLFNILNLRFLMEFYTKQIPVSLVYKNYHTKNLDVWQVSSSWLKQTQNYPSIYVASSSLNIHVKVSIKFWESFCIFYYILVLFLPSFLQFNSRIAFGS